MLHGPLMHLVTGKGGRHNVPADPCCGILNPLVTCRVERPSLAIHMWVSLFRAHRLSSLEVQAQPSLLCLTQDLESLGERCPAERWAILVSGDGEFNFVVYLRGRSDDLVESFAYLTRHIKFNLLGEG
jgi:hypothetical protein